MIAVSSGDVQRRFGFYSDEAMTRPVGIQRHGHTRLVLLSIAEYERLSRNDRQALRTEDLDETTIAAVAAARAPESARALNALLEDAATG